MSIYETSITNPKKQLEFYKQLSEQLEQENKKLNGAIQTYDILLKSNTEENKQLKDNWNKLKEIIKKKFVAQGGFTSYEWNDLLNELLDKMQELEQGSESNVQ